MNILVTGGGGFLGSEIAKLLIARGDTVRIVARSHYPEMEALGCDAVRGDLSQPDVIERSLAGIDAVIHTAAKAGVWGDEAEYVAANLTATQNIVDACERHDVQFLIHTSTPSVTFDGSDVENGGEDLPYPTTFLTHYARTKAEAEQYVLGAVSDHFHATALRPHLIYGPGDPHLLPRVIDRHRSGQLTKVGPGTNRVDVTYVTNAAWSHLDALDAFVRGETEASGRAFFVSDDHPVVLWDFIDSIVTELGFDPIPGSVSHGVARTAGAVLESMHSLFRPKVEPRMTRFVADQLSTSHWYDMEPLRDAVGYTPRVSPAEAISATIEDLRERGFYSPTRPS